MALRNRDLLSVFIGKALTQEISHLPGVFDTKVIHDEEQGFTTITEPIRDTEG